MHQTRQAWNDNKTHLAVSIKSGDFVMLADSILRVSASKFYPYLKSHLWYKDWRGKIPTVCPLTEPQGSCSCVEIEVQVAGLRVQTMLHAPGLRRTCPRHKPIKMRPTARGRLETWCVKFDITETSLQETDQKSSTMEANMDIHSNFTDGTDY